MLQNEVMLIYLYILQDNLVLAVPFWISLTWGAPYLSLQEIRHSQLELTQHVLEYLKVSIWDKTRDVQ